MSIKSRCTWKAICLCKRISSKQQKKTGPRTRNHKNSPIFAQLWLRNSGADRETKYARFPSQRYKIYGTQVGEITRFATDPPPASQSFPPTAGNQAKSEKPAAPPPIFHISPDKCTRGARARRRVLGRVQKGHHAHSPEGGVSMVPLFLKEAPLWPWGPD